MKALATIVQNVVVNANIRNDSRVNTRIKIVGVTSAVTALIKTLFAHERNRNHARRVLNDE